MKLQKLITLICLILMANNLFGADLSISFNQTYKNNKPLSTQELRFFKQYDFYLIPGILSETFIEEDKRSVLDFSLLTGEYFGAQINTLQNKYGLKTERLPSSSLSVEEIKNNINKAIDQSTKTHRKVIFISHSLGGLALLEELLTNEENQKNVGGIIFLQSPFNGTPIAEVFLKYPYHLDKILKPVMPFFNSSEETVHYLSVEDRSKFMTEQHNAVLKLVKKIPTITVGGVANGYNSLFLPAIELIKSGCLKTIAKKCLTPKLYQGSYDLSDGMVPFESSKLPSADFIRLEGADHGELVVDVPFENYQKENLTESLLKLLYLKIQ